MIIISYFVSKEGGGNIRILKITLMELKYQFAHFLPPICLLLNDVIANIGVNPCRQPLFWSAERFLKESLIHNVVTVTCKSNIAVQFSENAKTYQTKIDEGMYLQ